MTGIPLSDRKLERLFLACLKGKSLGLGPTDLVTCYVQLHRKSEKTGWTHLERVRKGMAGGTLRRIVSFKGPNGERFGDAENAEFLQRKADVEEKPPEVANAIWHLGGRYQNCPVRLSWEYCPYTNRLRQVAVVRVGVADFMRCSICHRFHFMGLSPKVSNTRPQVWELDPGICWRDYEDQLTVELIGDPNRPDPKINRMQPTEIERVRKGGRWIGMRLRISWDEDPYKRMYLGQWEHRKKTLTASTNVPVEG